MITSAELRQCHPQQGGSPLPFVRHYFEALFRHALSDEDLQVILTYWLSTYPREVRRDVSGGPIERED